MTRRRTRAGGPFTIGAMDSVTQIALGSAVAVAAMGRRTAVWKAALWGAVAATLPDLDVLIDHGNPVLNMVLHRAETHALFWLTLVSLPLAALVAWLHGERALLRRWWWALWLVLVTHPLLDALTIYGTQLGLPFTDHPFGVGSVFVIDPLVTLPLLAGVGWALAARGSRRGQLANAVGLVLSTAYLVWGLAVQQHVQRIALASLQAQGIAAERVLVTPTAFNSVLWRVLAVDGDDHLEGFYSLFDAEPRVEFDRFDRGRALADELREVDAVRRIAAFSKGFYKLRDEGGRVLVSDLRMGQEPSYIFTFAVAEHRSALRPLEVPVQVGTRPDIGRALPWLWRRLRGEPLAPPR